MDATHLDARRNKILEFIIQTYVETAAPVGSEAVCRRFHLRVSPATVRNAMGALEAAALLTHPHTSAGRIPTDKGYRYYVDLLMLPQTLLAPEAAAIQTLRQDASLDDPLELLQRASQVLAELTGQASIVLAPRVTQSTLRRIDLIPVDAHRVLGVLMTAEGLLKHALVDLDEMIDVEELARVSRFLNEELSGQSLGTVHERLQQALMDANNAFNYLYRRAQAFWELGGFLEADETVFIHGLSRLMTQPEFQHVAQHRPLLEVFEGRQSVAAALSDTMAQGRRRALIGAENPEPSLGQCSVVSAPYRAGARVAGAVGVIGPTRMEYPRVVAVVDQVAEAVSRAMERFLA